MPHSHQRYSIGSPSLQPSFITLFPSIPSTPFPLLAFLSTFSEHWITHLPSPLLHHTIPLYIFLPRCSISSTSSFFSRFSTFFHSLPSISSILLSLLSFLFPFHPIFLSFLPSFSQPFSLPFSLYLHSIHGMSFPILLHSLIHFFFFTLQSTPSIPLRSFLPFLFLNNPRQSSPSSSSVCYRGSEALQGEPLQGRRVG